MKQYQEHVTDGDGIDHHPAFGMARINRVHASPGAVLFQSDVQHTEYIEITLCEATRKRDLSSDWVHAGRTLVKFGMSLAQFAGFISSGGTEGVPVTIDYDHGDRPGLILASRLALTASEVHAAAQKAYEQIQAAEEAYAAAVKDKAPAAVRKQLADSLHWTIKNAAPNVDFAATRLTEHAESVAEKMRADIEAMATGAMARQQLAEHSAAVAITDGDPR